MTRWLLETPLGEVRVSLATDKPDQRARIEYVGEDDAIRLVRFWLAAQDGHSDHLLGSGATPRELERAMSRAKHEVALSVVKTQ